MITPEHIPFLSSAAGRRGVLRGLLCVFTCCAGFSATNSFDAFKVVTERNIFNQSRGPRSAQREAAPPRRTPQVHSLSLVGTMSYQKGDFAFFEGTRPEYRKPVKRGDKIAGYEVKEITPQAVKVANETQEFEIKVGQQLRKEDEGEWQLAMGATRPAPASESSSGSSGGGDSEDEALKRLMEKRAREMNQ